MSERKRREKKEKEELLVKHKSELLNLKKRQRETRLTEALDEWSSNQQKKLELQTAHILTSMKNETV